MRSFNKYLVHFFLSVDLILIVLGCFNFEALVEKASLPEKYKPKINSFSFNINEILKSEKITKIDDQKISHQWEIEFHLTHHSIGEDIVITSESAGQKKLEKVSLIPSNSTFDLITIAIVTLLYFFTGIYILIRFRKENYSYVLHWLAIATAIMVCFDTGSLRTFGNGFNFILISVFNIGVYLVPVLFLHFSFTYPVSNSRYKLMLLVPFYFASLTGIICSLLNISMFTLLGVSVEKTYYNHLHTFIADIFLIAGLILTVAKFEQSALIISEPLLRRKIYWALLGISFGPFVYVFLILMPRLILGFELVSDSLMQLTILIAPIMFLISVSQKK